MNATSSGSVSRRELFRIGQRFGITSTMLALAAAGTSATPTAIAQTASKTAAKRGKVPAKHVFRFGGAGWNEQNLLTNRVGCLEFVRDLEERTDGAIRVEFAGSNQLCNELDCVKKTQQGIIQIFTAATQNSAGAAPYYNVLDYAYMFPTRASMYHFLYHPASRKLLREPLEKRHGVVFLFTPCELRGLVMGQRWKDKPEVKTIEALAGTKNRVTGTQLGQIAMRLMNLNPVPIAWEETLDGLRTGLLDGAETWMSAAAAFNMAPVLSQAVNLGFMAGTEHTAMSAKVFGSLSSDLQEAVMESAFYTQTLVQMANEAALINRVGATSPQQPGTVFALNKVRVSELPVSELKKAEQMCSPASNPKPWEQWRERLNEWAGGVDTYTEIRKIAHEIPRETLAETVAPRRWWTA